MEHVSGVQHAEESVDGSAQSAGYRYHREQTLIFHDNTVKDRLRHTRQQSGEDVRSGDSADSGSLLALQIRADGNSHLCKYCANTDTLDHIAAKALQILQRDGREAPVKAQDCKKRIGSTQEQACDHLVEIKEPYHDIRHYVSKGGAKGSEENHGKGYHDHQTQHRHQKQLQLPLDNLFQPLVQKSIHNHRDKYGEHCGGVINGRYADSQKIHAFRRQKPRKIRLQKGRPDGAAHIGVPAELFCQRDSQKDRQEVEHRVRSRRQNQIGAVLIAHGAKLNQNRQQGLHHTGARQYRDQRRERAGNHLHYTVHHISLGPGGLLRLPLSKLGDGKDRFIIVGDRRANHHLVLSAADDHLHDVGQLIERLLIRLLFILQFKTQPGGTVHEAYDIFFAAHQGDNFLCFFYIFHFTSPALVKCFLLL